MTVKECRGAAEVVIRLVEQQAFFQELKVLQRGFQGDSLPSSSPLLCLDPILDGGLLCIGGRLERSTLSQELKHLIILPKDSHITKLILSHYHIQIFHQGRGQTLMEVRANKFWPIGGSKSIAKLIHRCVQCRKLRQPRSNECLNFQRTCRSLSSFRILWNRLLWPICYQAGA